MAKTIWIKGAQTPAPTPFWPVLSCAIEQQGLGVPNWRRFVLTVDLRPYRLPPRWCLEMQWSWTSRPRAPRKPTDAP